MDEEAQGFFKGTEGWSPELIARSLPTSMNVFPSTCAGQEISRGFCCQMPQWMDTCYQQAGIGCNLSLSISLCVHLCLDLIFVFCFRQWIEFLQQSVVMWQCSTHLKASPAWTLWMPIFSSHAYGLKLRTSYFKQNGNTQFLHLISEFDLSPGGTYYMVKPERFLTGVSAAVCSLHFGAASHSWTAAWGIEAMVLMGYPVEDLQLSGFSNREPLAEQVLEWLLTWS